MKVVRKTLSLMMIVAISFSLVACKSYKKVTGKQFTKKMEAEDYVVKESETRGFEECLIARSQDGNIAFEYYYGEDKSAASEIFDNVHQNIKNDKKNGTLKKTTNKVEFKGSFESDSELASLEYVVAIRADEMVIVAYSASKDSEYVDEIDGILDDLCG